MSWRTLNLAPGGRSLIEASAGTGKTWTIAALYLRLVLEQKLSPRRIVVATYTNAAAAELKERLRARIESALAQAASGDVATEGQGDPALAWLQERWNTAPDARQRDVIALPLALAELDIAPIGTLHSLCSRVLSEHPFAAGAAFTTPALADSSAMQRELAEDLVRILHAGGEVDALAGPVRDAANRLERLPDVRELTGLLKSLGLPGVVVPEADAVEAPWDQTWLSPLRALAEDETVWSKKSKIRRLLSAIEEMIGSCGTQGALSDDDLVYLQDNAPQRTGILRAAQGRKDVEEVLDFVAHFAEHLKRCRRSSRLRFYAALQAWATTQSRRRLAAANQLGFDELLVAVRDALQPDTTNGTRALADALFAAWPVALIDEFQDTDPVQYAILDAIYRDAAGNARGRLLLIGDPKQAIYRFRGGDIHTYERAKKQVEDEDRLTLGINHRSSKAYVEAVNAFYARCGKKLGAADSGTTVEYVDVQASGRLDEKPYAIEGKPVAKPLVLYRHQPEQEGDEVAALRSCAEQIAYLLDPDNRHRIGDAPLAASDICVLVPSHFQAARMVELLRERNVACVNRGRGSVFDGETARDLLLVLDAVAHDDQPGRLRAALATRLMGMGYHQLRAMQKDAGRWQDEAAWFHRWHHDWDARGVLAVIAGLIDRHAPQLLELRDGERILTDLRHLGELLQEQGDRSDGMESLLAWFREQIDSGDAEEDAAEARALRLESDAQCAQVMTLHASKGLEFPLVFLPLMWKHTGRESDLYLLSQEDGSRRVAVDAGDRQHVEREEQDERFRVLYVALTRARHACHVWLPSEKAAARQKEAKAAPLTLLAANLSGPDDAPIEVVGAWPEHPKVRAPVARTEASPRHARPLPPERKGPLPSRHSFSTLARAPKVFELDPGASAQDESETEAAPLATVQVGEASTRTPHPEISGLLGAAGTEFGNAVHAILEHHDPSVPLTAQSGLVRAQLAAFAVQHRTLPQEDFATTLAARLQAVLDTDLDGSGLRLSRLAVADQRHEMEFNYALDGASLMRLREACAKAGFPDMVPARHATLAGLMNGKIDLVFRHDGRFHLLDWKGNLGANDGSALEDYAPAALEEKIDGHRYRFQALLYAVALERYLKSRLGSAYQRGKHLGDCWYVFIRAAGLRLPDGTACGIWRHRFDDAMLDAVQDELASQRKEAA